MPSKPIPTRFPEEWLDAIDSKLHKDEDQATFIRLSVIRELKRRKYDVEKLPPAGVTGRPKND